jgi:hypothetical protein
VLVGLHEAGRETPPENVVAAAVEGVEGARVLTVQVAHPGREVRLRRLDEEVVVVAQEAAGVQPPSVPADDSAQLVEESAAVVVVEEAERAVVAAGRDVVPGAGSEVAAGASHCADGSSRPNVRMGL